MRIRDERRHNPSAPMNVLLHCADSFAAQPTETVMKDLGLTREKAQSWQRICAELAEVVRVERGMGRSRLRWYRPRRARGTPAARARKVAPPAARKVAPPAAGKVAPPAAGN